MNIQFFAIKIVPNVPGYVYASDINWLVIILNDILYPVSGQGHVTCKDVY